MRAISMVGLLAAVGAVAGCGDTSVVRIDDDPNVTITAPLDGAEFARGDTITFEGLVSDSGTDPEFLLVSWISSVDGALEEESFVEADGSVTMYTSALSSGEHTIVLRAIDLDNNAADAQIGLNIVNVPDKPSMTVLHPDIAGEELGLEEAPFTFMVEVSDYQDLPEDLVVELVASPYGLVCQMSPDGSGIAQCPGILPVGDYSLTFTVTDTDGNAIVANTPYKVVSRDDYDADGDGYSPNAGDCNDSAVQIYPGAPEICDGLDNDCIEATAIDVGTECYDDDGDGYCEVPPCVNTTNTVGDCDDTDPSRYPDLSVQEIVNGEDDNCDGRIDEGTVVYDDDSDGYCESPPCVNTSATESDCDDNDTYTNPAETEVCSDGIDNNCDGQYNEEDAIGCSEFYKDVDGDTYGVSGPTQCWCDDGASPWTGLDTSDCYDSNANAYPGQSSFFTGARGDGSYDYDCDTNEEKELTGRTTGCSWDFEPFSCNIDGVGWVGSEPACGRSGTYSDDCSGSYDTWCMAICLLTGTYASCSSCWSCDADEYSITQACR